MTIFVFVILILFPVLKSQIWDEITVFNRNFKVRVSGNGLIIARFGAFIEISNDIGKSWVKSTYFSISEASGSNGTYSQTEIGGYITDIAISETGEHMIAIASTVRFGILRSEDFGASWYALQWPCQTGVHHYKSCINLKYETQVGLRRRSSVTMSQDGQCVAVEGPMDFIVERRAFSDNFLVVSNDGGLTFEQMDRPSNSFFFSECSLKLFNIPDLPRPLRIQALKTESVGGQVLAWAAGPPAVSYIPGGIFVSFDSGTSWMQSDAPENAFWRSISSSASGQVMVATAGISIATEHPFISSSVWRSVNWGRNWTKIASLPVSLPLVNGGLKNITWVDAQMSKGAQTLIVSGVVGSRRIQLLTNLSAAVTGSPVSSSSLPPPSPRPSQLDGQQAELQLGRHYLGSAFTLSIVPANGTRVFTLSGDGHSITRISPSGIAVSIDSGRNWRNSSVMHRDNSTEWTAAFSFVLVASDYTGQTQLAVSDSREVFSLWMSYDYGETYEPVRDWNPDDTLYAIIPAKAAVMDSQGQCIFVRGLYSFDADAESNFTLVVENDAWSGDFGSSFIPSPSDGPFYSHNCEKKLYNFPNVLRNREITAESNSGDGSTLFKLVSADAACRSVCQDPSVSTGVFKSTDKGYSWNQVGVPPGIHWQSLSVSFTGQYVVATSTASASVGSQLWRSVDWGSTWTVLSSTTQAQIGTKTVVSPSWIDARISSSGSRIVALVNQSTDTYFHIFDFTASTSSPTTLPVTAAQQSGPSSYSKSSIIIFLLIILSCVVAVVFYKRYRGRINLLSHLKDEGVSRTGLQTPAGRTPDGVEMQGLLKVED